MGRFAYDKSVTVEFDDRTLAHLQIVIGMKLRRDEPFYFSWRDDDRIGDGRTSVWIDPTVPLVFSYYGSAKPAINPAWIHALELTANTNVGLRVVAEPDHPQGRPPATR